MSHFLLRAGWAALQPSSLIALLLIAGTVLTAGSRGVRAGRWFLASGAFLYVVLGFSPAPNWLLAALEESCAKASPDALARADGIIVLGGAIDTAIFAKRGEPALNEAAERMTEAVRLARQMPNLPLIFTGGDGGLIATGWTEAQAARQFFEGFDIAPPRLQLEGNSHNTIENAEFTARLVHPAPGQHWVLITSAFHMPRAKSLFEARGFNIIPWPVDYRTAGWQDRWRFSIQASEGLRRADLAVKEWVGLGFARLTGKIS